MLTSIKRGLKILRREWQIVLLGFVTVWLRFVNLGYSDYQGDEIKAFLIPDEGQTTLNFLLTQRKGPIQFLITYLIGLIDPTYTHRFFVRLPFALAGVLAVFFFYKLVEIHFNKKVAFFGSFFLATNGFFIAFSRIVQYQSFVISFGILSLYFFTRASREAAWAKKGIYLGFILWALSILSHYDGVFIFPMVLYLIYSWAKTQHQLNIQKSIKALLVPGIMFTGLLAAFYIPFALEISKDTLAYWQGRLGGTGGKISSSKYLFRVYQPIYVIHIYTALAFLGGLFVFQKLVRYLKRRDWNKVLFLISLGMWILIPIIFLEFLVSIPGTHIYTYILPLFIFLGLGVDLIGVLLRRVLGKIVFTDVLFILGAITVFTFISLQMHYVYIENATEYPWEPEQYLIWTFPNPNTSYHLSLFGFPYYRSWDEIGRLVRNSDHNGYYLTNERSTISQYHLPLDRSKDKAGYYIYIRNPQSFKNKIIPDKAAYWVKNYNPITTFFKEGEPIVEIYYMAEGSLEEIKKAGY